MVFRKASMLPYNTPSSMIEDYLYGSSFVDYSKFRLQKMGRSFLADNDPLCDDFHMKRAKWRVKPGKIVGEFTKKFMTIQNDCFETYFTKIPRRATKRTAKAAIFKFNKDERQRWQEQRRSRPQPPPDPGALQQQPLRPPATATGLRQPHEQPRLVQTAGASALQGAPATTTTATATEAVAENSREEVLR